MNPLSMDFFYKKCSNLEFILTDIKAKGLKHAYQYAYRHNWTKVELEAYLYAENETTS